MALSEHKFRYFIPPGHNFHFVRKFKIWVLASFVLLAASIGILFINKSVRGAYMNWSIDFKGGTEVVYAFHDKANPSAYVKLDPAKVRAALQAGGEQGFDVGDYDYTGKSKDGSADVKIPGMVVLTPRFSAVTADKSKKSAEAFVAKFADRDVEKASWSGDTLYVRSKKLITDAEASPVLAGAGLNIKKWDAADTALNTHADEGTGDFNSKFAVSGVADEIGKSLETAFPNAIVEIANSNGVGAKAGDKLRDDAAKSLFYALFLIMLYLAFRFDIRYAPGAAFATVHDAVMVIGVFALTWTEVSLTTVAALLTVIGYSVNDTVIIFDRIRENQTKHKDKKLEKVIDISINEMLGRSIMTSSTVFAITLLMNIFGEGLIRNFAFAMNIGVVVGTYSSIFMASPIFLWIATTWYSDRPMSPRQIQAAALAAEP